MSAKDALEALVVIYKIYKFIESAPEKASKNQSMARQIVRRLYVFEPLIDSIKKQCEGDQEQFLEPGKMDALKGLRKAMEAVEEWTNKHLPPKAGVLAWAKGAWNAADNKEKLVVIAGDIDRCVADLTLIMGQADSPKPQTPPPETP